MPRNKKETTHSHSQASEAAEASYVPRDTANLLTPSDVQTIQDALDGLIDGDLVATLKAAGMLLSGDLDLAGNSIVNSNLNDVVQTIFVLNPGASEDIPICNVPTAATMVSVTAVTDVGTVDFNIEKRDRVTPDVAGTNIWSADKQATAAGLTEISFDSGAIAAGDWLNFNSSAVASAPTKLWIAVRYAID